MSISLRSGARGVQRLPLSINYNISIKMAIFGTPSSTPVRDRHICPLTFLYQIEFQQLLYEEIFDRMRIFASFGPNMNLLYHFRTFLIFWKYLKLSYMHASCVSFYMKKFLMECVFLAGSRPYSESTLPFSYIFYFSKIPKIILGAS